VAIAIGHEDTKVHREQERHEQERHEQERHEQERHEQERHEQERHEQLFTTKSTEHTERAARTLVHRLV